MKKFDFNKLTVKKPYSNSKNNFVFNSEKIFGIDTEADVEGKCFLICLSNGISFPPAQFPEALFRPLHRNGAFFCFNLRYDESALLQKFSIQELEEFWKDGQIEKDGYKYISIPHKCLSISHGKNSVHIYDLQNFLQGSLNYNAQKYLNESKIEIDTKKFTQEYINNNFELIKKYCIQDAVLCEKLARLVIQKLYGYGVYAKKFYSIAYISQLYFQKNCNLTNVHDIMEKEPQAVYYALKSYQGGKFEVTEKGCGYFFEYDIVSAYPAEIYNLLDISNCRIVWDKKYRKDSIYGFLKVKKKIPESFFDCNGILHNNTRVFASGEVETYITKEEYDYYIKNNIDVEIVNACWLHTNSKKYVFRKEIDKLTQIKKELKEKKDELGYFLIKRLMNSLYGKLIQTIEKDDKVIASQIWNPFWASVITANVRIRVSQLQNNYNVIIAVHTDSVISKKQLDIVEEKNFGGFEFEKEGQGLIAGCGIYQIGDKTKIRGVKIKKDLFELFDTNKKELVLNEIHVPSWREVVSNNWEKEKINLFYDRQKVLDVNFDKKRVWINDYKKWSDIFCHSVNSLPHLVFNEKLLF
jgi:hypothetical protein